MIHYHGGPITPLSVAKDVWKGRHGFVSFARPEQTGDIAELCSTFAADNGAFSVWRRGGALDVPAYADYVREWYQHPGFDWCLIPDSITGGDAENDALIEQWHREGLENVSVPVWHLHETLERLRMLVETFPRVAFGSSGKWAKPNSDSWWDRMHEAMGVACGEDGYPLAKLHGLRMLNPTVFSQLPFASADSTNVAQNHARERRRHRCSPTLAALLVVDRIESHASAPRYANTRGTRMNLELYG